MSPYVTSAVIGGALMFALQFTGLGFIDDVDAYETPPIAINIAHR